MTARSEQARVDNPYVGPRSFRLGDPLYGRDRERADLVDMLIAERIVLLYSPSGAGKTSLIQAALVPALQQDGFDVLPTIRVTHVVEPRPGAPIPRNRYMLSVLLSLEEGVPPARQRPVVELATLTLREYLDANADLDGRHGNQVLIFDQFEELLTVDPTDEATKRDFVRELGETLRDRGHWALFAVREEFLAGLDPYRLHLPTRLRTTIRSDFLDVNQALEAMRRPAEQAGVYFSEEAARKLVDDLRTVRVQVPGGAAQVLGSYVEPVQLQVTCRMLWSVLSRDATEITRADIDSLGRVDQALADYYADGVRMAAERSGVPERAVRKWFEERLITPQGLRGQVLEGPQAGGEAAHRLLTELVDAHLLRADTRRQATWFELAHDRLIEPILQDNTAWFGNNMSSFERAAALWEQQGKPDHLLLHAGALSDADQDDAVRTDALTQDEREFLEMSRRADAWTSRDQHSTRQLRILVAVLTLLLLATTCALVIAVWP